MRIDGRPRFDRVNGRRRKQCLRLTAVQVAFVSAVVVVKHWPVSKLLMLGLWFASFVHSILVEIVRKVVWFF